MGKVKTKLKETEPKIINSSGCCNMCKHITENLVILRFEEVDFLCPKCYNEALSYSFQKQFNDKLKEQLTPEITALSFNGLPSYENVFNLLPKNRVFEFIEYLNFIKSRWFLSIEQAYNWLEQIAINDNRFKLVIEDTPEINFNTLYIFEIIETEPF